MPQGSSSYYPTHIFQNKILKGKSIIPFLNYIAIHAYICIFRSKYEFNFLNLKALNHLSETIKKQTDITIYI